MGDVLGGGVVFAIAAVLWIVYLIPTWKRRRHFDATERNAVRMQQTIRALAETADVPQEVEIEASARAVIEQKRILREAEALALAEVRAATAKAVGFDLEAYHRRRRARTARLISAIILFLTLVGTIISGIFLFTGGEWQPLALWAIGFALALFVQEAVVSSTALKVTAPARVAHPFVDMGAQAQTSTRSWSPTALPKPLHLSPGSLAAAVVQSQIQAERMRLSSAEDTLVERLRVNGAAIAEFKQAQATQANSARATTAAPGVPVPARASVSARLAAMGVVSQPEQSALDLDEVLRRRRAV